MNLLQCCFCFMFCFFGPKAYGFLAHWPGMEPSALEGKVLTTGLPEKPLIKLIFEDEGKNPLCCNSQQNTDSSFYSSQNFFFSTNEHQPMYISGDWNKANMNLLVHSIFFPIFFHCYRKLNGICITSHFIYFICPQSNFKWSVKWLKIPKLFLESFR